MRYKLYNTSLNPKLWERVGSENVLRPEVREMLLKIADDFVKDIEENGTKLSVEDIILVGSSVNYNWTQFSDLDLHLAVDFSKLPYDEKDVANMFDALRAKWNTSHDITIKGMDIEVFIQNGVEAAESDAVYSVKDGKWIKEPTVQNPKFNKDVIKKKHREFKTKIDQLLKDPNSDTVEEELKKILDKLYRYRQTGLDKKGEFSEENIVFKILRAQGYLDKIKEIVRALYDKDHTIEEKLQSK